MLGAQAGIDFNGVNIAGGDQDRLQVARPAVSLVKGLFQLMRLAAMPVSTRKQS
jgi:hypothetical protein